MKSWSKFSTFDSKSHLSYFSCPTAFRVKWSHPQSKRFSFIVDLQRNLSKTSAVVKSILPMDSSNQMHFLMPVIISNRWKPVRTWWVNFDPLFFKFVVCSNHMLSLIIIKLISEPCLYSLLSFFSKQKLHFLVSVMIHHSKGICGCLRKNGFSDFLDNEFASYDMLELLCCLKAEPE